MSLSALRKLLQDVPRPDGYGMVAPASWGEDVPVEEQTRIPMKRTSARHGTLEGKFYLLEGEGQRCQVKVVISYSRAASLREPAMCSSERVRLYSFTKLRACFGGS